MKVFIASILFGREGFCIASGKDTKGGPVRLIFHAERVPVEGETWDVEGPLENHLEHGPQMKVESAIWLRPGGDLIIPFLEYNPAFRGINIGKARVTDLWNHFGEGLYEILDKGDSMALREANVVPTTSIIPLLKAWSEVMEEGRVVRWLTEHDFPVGLAMKLIRYYGGKVTEKLNADPYKLLALVGWNKCETVAEKLGVAKDDPRRLCAAAQQALYARLNHGSTMMKRSNLEYAVARKYLGAGSGQLAKQAVDVAVSKRAIIEVDGWCALTGIRMLEIETIKFFRDLRDSRDDGNELIPTAGHEEVNKVIADCEHELGYQLNGEQRSAISLAIGNKFSLLTGGAGTGKTTVLRALAAHFGPSVYMMALSGQAARRMHQATGFEATTIERYIRKLSGNKDKSHRYIIIDEASMLDLPLTVRLLRSLTPDSRLLLVGDPEQLPPVNFGLIFHKLVDGGKAPRSHLTIVNRQKAVTGIPAVSASVRDGIVPEFGETEDGGVVFMETERSGIIDALIELKDKESKTQILAPLNGNDDENGVGVKNINRAFHLLYARGKPTLKKGGFALGDPVVYKRNDNELDLVNGSLGMVIGISDDGYSAEIDFEGNKKWISHAKLPYLQLAYALTVHKAQGSQFDNVAVVIQETQILDRTWIYTAITRGVKKVTLIGDRSAFDLAVKLPPRARNRDVLFNL